jgi:hemolysin III
MITLSKDGSVHVTDERINTIVSLVGSMFSVVLGSILLARVIFVSKSGMHHTFAEIMAVALYVLGFANLFVMSTLHHALDLSSKVNSVLRTLDYSAIFWHIAATVTVFVVFIFRDTYGISIAIATWIIAAAGIALRASVPRLPKHITNTLFITLGWLPATGLILHATSLEFMDFLLLGIGGILYSVGFIMYVTEKPNPIKGVLGFHEIWHVFVLVASLSHWLLIYRLVR